MKLAIKNTADSPECFLDSVELLYDDGTRVLAVS
jgi:hypothetical protein